MEHSLLHQRCREIARDMAYELDDPDLYEYHDFHEEDGVVSSVRAILASLLGDAEEKLPAKQVVTVLHRLAHEHINCVPYQAVDARWLLLYTDTAILETLAEVLSECQGDPREPGALTLIRQLDMAIIVGGASGRNRMERISSLISYLQTGIQRAMPINPVDRAIKRRRLREHGNSIMYAPGGIAELGFVPSLEVFTSQLSSSPFVLRGYVNRDSITCPRWPAVDRWKSAQYLLDTAGPGRVVPVELGRAYDEDSWSQRILPWEDFLGRAGFLHTPNGEEEAMYLAQYSLFRQMPGLERDIALPDYAWSQLDATDYPSYRPLQTPEINVWVGSGSSDLISPAHTDPYFNCYVQVVGEKRVWLAPPTIGRHMQPYNIDSHEGSAAAKEYMGNTSRVPILKEAPEEVWRRHPRFTETVYPQARETILHPGDMLFMPPGWWHAMRGEGDGPGWSVSIWF